MATSWPLILQGILSYDPHSLFNYEAILIQHVIHCSFAKWAIQCESFMGPWMLGIEWLDLISRGFEISCVYASCAVVRAYSPNSLSPNGCPVQDKFHQICVGLLIQIILLFHLEGHGTCGNRELHFYWADP